VSEIGVLNDKCDAFVLGSDQIWNYGVTKIFGHSYFLDFAGDDKKKIAYATSFGSGKFLAPRAYTKEAVRCMRRMDAVSVREKEGVDICRKTFGVKATHVLDPVLMCEPHVLGDLTKRSDRQETEPFIATYILDPTPEKREALLHVSKEKGKKLVNMLDGWYNKFEGNKKRLNLDNTIENLQVEDWLYYLKNSDFVITDSFHGTCMAILFHKPFIAIGNPGRGTSRFESLLGTLGLTHRYVMDPKEIRKRKELLSDVDYTKVDAILDRQRTESRAWLAAALAGEKKNAPTGMGAKLTSFVGSSCAWGEYYFRNKVKPLAKRILRR
jgi:polysaccharide pyruvyl transferase WcaK-like protein